jgi:hypothetical protein
MTIPRIAAIFLFAFLPVQAFAAAPSPLSQLPAAEHDYYTQIFDYTMFTVKSGGHYDWKSTSGNGSIALSDDAFTSKSNSVCRHFSETFTILGQSGGNQGVACKRSGRDGWCKLKPGYAQTCALEEPASLFDQAANGSEQAEVNVEGKTTGMWESFKALFHSF